MKAEHWLQGHQGGSKGDLVLNEVTISISKEEKFLGIMLGNIVGKVLALQVQCQE